MKKFDLEAAEENLKLTLEKDVLGRNSNLIMLEKLISNINENIKTILLRCFKSCKWWVI